MVWRYKIKGVEDQVGDIKESFERINNFYGGKEVRIEFFIVFSFKVGNRCVGS